MSRVCGGLVLVLLAAHASSAAAQPPALPRLLVAVDVAYRNTAHDFTDTVATTTNAEAGRVITNYVIPGDSSYAVGVAAAVSRVVAIGVRYSRESQSVTATVDATVPHPFFFNTPRQVGGTVSGLTHQERTLAVEARFLVVGGRRFQVTLAGGPALVSVDHRLVRDVQITEAYPYDEAVFAGAQTEAAKESAWGFSGGGNVDYYFSSRIGVGGGVRYSSATVSLPTANGRAVDYTAGGLEVAGGLRVRVW